MKMAGISATKTQERERVFAAIVLTIWKIGIEILDMLIKSKRIFDVLFYVAPLHYANVNLTTIIPQSDNAEFRLNWPQKLEISFFGRMKYDKYEQVPPHSPRYSSQALWFCHHSRMQILVCIFLALICYPLSEHSVWFYAFFIAWLSSPIHF